MVGGYSFRVFVAGVCVLAGVLVSACSSSLSGSPTGSLSLTEQKAGAADTGAPLPLAQAVSTFTAAATPGNAAYKIGPQDVLDITVFKVPDLTRSVRVSEAGTITYPLIGEVKASGKTAEELERTLKSKLGAKYLQSPDVSVAIKEFNSRRVTIDGAVAKPGVYPLVTQTTLLQAIAMAGGPTDVSDTSDIVIFRDTAGKRSAARFDLGEIRAGNTQDPPLQQGDVVVLNNSQMKVTFNYIMKALPISSMFVPLL